MVKPQSIIVTDLSNNLSSRQTSRQRYLRTDKQLDGLTEAITRYSIYLRISTYLVKRDLLFTVAVIVSN